MYAERVMPSLSSLDFRRYILESKGPKLCLCICGVMSTLMIYGVMQEKIMRVPYGNEKDYFQFSLFIVFCNRLLTVAVSSIPLLNQRNGMAPVAPIYKYGAVSVSNILTTTCQYEALKYVSFPVQTLAKCAKMIPVMVWGTLIMQKRYTGRDYFLAMLVTAGCAVFILYPAGAEASPYSKGSESTVWGILLMGGYLGFDGFTSTFQDKLFKGYNMDIYNQIFYVTFCSSILSMLGLLVQGQWNPAISFIRQHPDCLSDILLLSMVATASQFFISSTIHTFGALIFSIIMTTRQVRRFSLVSTVVFVALFMWVCQSGGRLQQSFIKCFLILNLQLMSILLSCVWFAHPLSWQQFLGGLVVFGSLYLKSFYNQKSRRPSGGRNITLPSESEMEEGSLIEKESTSLKNSTGSNGIQTAGPS